MRRQWSYILLITVLAAILVTAHALNPAPVDWTPTLASEDKIPFGTFVLDDRLTDIFPETRKSYLSFYEQQDNPEPNQLVISTNYFPDNEDMNALLAHVHSGGNALISAHYFTEAFSDTLNFAVEDYLFDGAFISNLKAGDSASLAFSTPSADGEFLYKRNNVTQRFLEIDTANALIVARNDLGQPVTIRQKFGDGEFILNSTPMVFSNLYLLNSNNSDFAAGTLSLLPAEPLHWAEFYMQGRRQSGSPLRFILSEPALTWGYYLLLASLVLYMVIESKRKQRIIPVMEPPKNSTLEFIGTVSSLYYKKKDHRSIANKRINYFLEQLNRRYYIPQHLEGKELYTKIAAKSGKSAAQVEATMNLILGIRTRQAIGEEELKVLNKNIDEFKL